MWFLSDELCILIKTKYKEVTIESYVKENNQGSFSLSCFHPLFVYTCTCKDSSCKLKKKN